MQWAKSAPKNLRRLAKASWALWISCSSQRCADLLTYFLPLVRFLIHGAPVPVLQRKPKSLGALLDGAFVPLCLWGCCKPESKPLIFHGGLEFGARLSLADGLGHLRPGSWGAHGELGLLGAQGDTERTPRCCLVGFVGSPHWCFKTTSPLSLRF